MDLSSIGPLNVMSISWKGSYCSRNKKGRHFCWCQLGQNNDKEIEVAWCRCRLHDCKRPLQFWESMVLCIFFLHMRQGTLLIIWLTIQLAFREKLSWPYDMSVWSFMQRVDNMLVKGPGPGVRNLALYSASSFSHAWWSSASVYILSFRLSFWISKIKTIMNVFLIQMLWWLSIMHVKCSEHTLEQNIFTHYYYNYK